VHIVKHRRHAGFSLVELAVVLFIVAIVLSMGLGALNAQMLLGNASITKKRQEVIKDALIAYLGANKRLPCAEVPAVGSITGQEACPNTIGTLPFVTLGLSRELATDGNGNLFSYRVSSQTAPTCAAVGASLGIDWKTTLCFGEGKQGTITVNDGTVTTPIVLSSQVIAVVVSHGANGLGGFAPQGSRNANPVTCEEAHNAIVAVGGCALTADTFYKGEREGNDDVVSFITATEAINALTRQGTIKSAAGRVADDLATARNQMLGAKASAVSCIIPIAAPPTNPDPWGNAYVTPTESPSLACVCSTGGTGATPPNAAACPFATPPTVCVTASAASVNATRLSLGLPAC